jgi:hypothetical protein
LPPSVRESVDGPVPPGLDLGIVATVAWAFRQLVTAPLVVAVVLGAEAFAAVVRTTWPDEAWLQFVPILPGIAAFAVAHVVARNRYENRSFGVWSTLTEATRRIPSLVLTVAVLVPLYAVAWGILRFAVVPRPLLGLGIVFVWVGWFVGRVYGSPGIGLQLVPLAGLGVLVLVGGVWNAFVIASVVAGVGVAWYLGRIERIRLAVRDLVREFPPTLVPFVLFVFLVFGTIFVERELARWLGGFVILGWLGVRTVLAGPAVAVGGYGPVAGLRAAWSRSRGTELLLLGLAGGFAVVGFVAGEVGNVGGVATTVAVDATVTGLVALSYAHAWMDAGGRVH